MIFDSHISLDLKSFCWQIIFYPRGPPFGFQTVCQVVFFIRGGGGFIWIRYNFSLTEGLFLLVEHPLNGILDTGRDTKQIDLVPPIKPVCRH